MLRLETGELAAFSVTVPEIYITVCTHVDISLPMGKFMYSCIYTCVQHTAAHAPSKNSKNTVGASDWSLLATGAWCAIISTPKQYSKLTNRPHLVLGYGMPVAFEQKF